MLKVHAQMCGTEGKELEMVQIQDDVLKGNEEMIQLLLV